MNQFGQNQYGGQGFGNPAQSYQSQGNVPLPQADAGISGSVHNKRRWDDEIRWFDFPDRTMVTLRFFGPVFITYNHWLKTRQGKRFPLCCPAYDQNTQAFVEGKCPIDDDFNIPTIIDAAKAANPQFSEEYDPTLKELKAIKGRINALTQVIIRNVSNLGDANLAAKPWHPVRLGPAVFFNLVRLKNMNVCTINGRQYQADIADPYWGRDVHVYYNSSEKNPQQKYMITLGDHTPLTELEKTYVKELFNWASMVEYASYDETKQSLQVNGYYQMLNALTNSAPSFAQDNNTQYAQYETLLRPPMPPSQYNAPDMPMPPTQGMPYQHASPQAQNTPYTVPMPQMGQTPPPGYPVAPMGNQPPSPGYMPPPNSPQNPYYGQPPMPMAEPPNLSGLNPVVPPATPIPNNVPPPLGYNSTIPTQEGEIDIPFDQPGRTYPLRGQQVSKDEFDAYVNEFAKTIPRGQPVQVAKTGELAGASVLACFGDYLGDTSCIKCPLRKYCVHA